MKLKKIINKNLSKLILGTTLGRALGVLRDFLIITLFGISLKSDQIYFLLLFPDFFNNLLSWSAIVTIFLPIIIKNPQRLNLFKFFKSRTELIGILVIIMASIYLLLDPNSEFKLEKIILCCTFLFGISFGFNLINEQYHNNFSSTSSANVIYNLGVILAILSAYLSTIFFSLLILFTVILRNYLSVRKNQINNYNLQNDLPEGKINQKRIIKNLIIIIPNFIALGFYGLNFTIDKFIITANEINGDLTNYSVAEKIFLLPLSIFLIPYFNELYPKLSKVNSIKNNLNLFLKTPTIFITLLAFIQNLGTILALYFLKAVNFYEISNLESIIYFVIKLNISLFFYCSTLYLINVYIAFNKSLTLSILLFIVFTIKFLIVGILKYNEPTELIWLNLFTQVILTFSLITGIILKKENDTHNYLWRRSCENC